MWFLLITLGSGLITGVLAHERGRSGGWMVVGVLIPVVTPLIMAAMPPTQRKREELALAQAEREASVKVCPHCLSTVDAMATRCPFCTSHLGGLLP